MKITSIKLLGLSLFMLFIGSCISRKYQERNAYYKHLSDFDCFKIGENLCIDQHETSNLNWLEYLAWLQIYLPDEYQAALPDTTVWQELDSFYYFASFFYYNSISYLNYPLVGITQEQAQRYAKWRRDRVLEYILVHNNIIKFDENDTVIFTVEKYFEGKYKDYKPDSNFLYYLDFRLPTYSEVFLAASVNDSIIKSKKRLRYRYIAVDLNAEGGGSNFARFPAPAGYGNYICNLIDNVSEWLSEDSTCFGGNWGSFVFNLDTFKTQKPSAFIGFRCVGEWKKWEFSNGFHIKKSKYL